MRPPRSAEGFRTMQAAGPRAWRSMQGRRSKPPAQKVHAMSDVSTSKPKAKAGELPKFEIPRFEIPKFEMPKMEVPAAFREFAEKSVSQCKDSWEKMKAVTE